MELFGHALSCQLPESADIQDSDFDVSSKDFGGKAKAKSSWKQHTLQAQLNMAASRWILLSANTGEILFSSINSPHYWVSLGFITAVQEQSLNTYIFSWDKIYN